MFYVVFIPRLSTLSTRGRTVAGCDYLEVKENLVFPSAPLDADPSGYTRPVGGGLDASSAIPSLADYLDAEYRRSLSSGQEPDYPGFMRWMRDTFFRTGNVSRCDLAVPGLGLVMSNGQIVRITAGMEIPTTMVEKPEAAAGSGAINVF